MDLRQFNPLKVLNHWQALNDIIRGSNPYPISCEIDPSNLCNHDCIWCINGKFRKSNKVSIPRDLIFRVIKEMAKRGVKSVAFTGGGEPFMNPATTDAIRLAKSLKMDVGLVTNGELLDLAKCKAIINNCSYVRISLDAATERTHRLVHASKSCPKGAFKRIVNNIGMLVGLRNKTKKKITIGAGYLVSIYNYREIAKAAQLLRGLGVDYMQIRPAFMLGKQLSKKIRAETEKLIRKAIKFSDSNFHVIPILHRFDEVVNLDRAYDRCYGHGLVGVVAGNAKMYICCQLRGMEEFCIGDLTKESFSKIWRGTKRKEVIKKINLDRCLPCRYNKYNELLYYLASKERPHKNFL